jgi:hypothetical protein
LVSSPIADITVFPADTICSGEEVTLSVSQIGAIYSWSTLETTQSISDTLFANGNVPQIVTYSITVGIAGCSEIAEDSVQILVNPIPSILNIVSSLDSLCLGDSITLTASVQPLGGLYAWNPGTISTDSSLQYVPTNVGWNNFTLNYELDGCSVNDSIAVFVNPIPLVNASGDAICAGDTAALSATANIVGGSFEWYLGITQVGTGASIQVTPADTTTYQLVYTSPAQCVNDSTQVTVYAFAVPVISGLTNQSICPNDTISLVSNVSILGGNFTWTNQNNVQEGVGNPLIVSPNDTTLYTVQYDVNYGFGVTCSDTAQALVNVFAAPIIQNMNFVDIGKSLMKKDLIQL